MDELDPDAMQFFNPRSVNYRSSAPLRYGPLVHALSALSVGSNSLTNNIPTSSIDSAVTSFQQLLETLTQTISDLLRFLPRTTWDDNSSFDGVLRDMLKAEDVLEEHEEAAAVGGNGINSNGSGKEDEVVALTLALEKRARWMEVQLAKLEELHRDINTAAVRAVLSSNDKGWDSSGFLPRLGDAVNRFAMLGKVNVNDGSASDGEGTGKMRKMTAEELDAALAESRKEETAVEAELISIIENNKLKLL
jgi:CCR4-NOT transcription complex subunit 4